MATFRDLIDRTRNELMTGWPDRLNQLGVALNSTEDQITFAHEATGIGTGTRISIGLEDMYVFSASNSTATVIRGYGGSTASAHSLNDLILVAPNFSDFRIGEVINEGLASLTGEGMFAVRNTQFDFIPVRMGYDLPSTNDLLSVIQVNYDMPGPRRDWTQMQRQDWRLNQEPDPTLFPSGKQLVLRRPGFPGHAIHVVYKATYTPLANEADDVETVAGLQNTAFDLPVLYSAYRLNTGREVKRSLLTRQGEPRRQEEVPPGSMKLAHDNILDVYESRVRTEVRRLARQYPEAA